MARHWTTRLRLAAAALLGTFAASLSGCLPHQEAAIRGGPDGVLISYAGDVSATLPLARQHCAQFERVPVLTVAKENTAKYVCVRPNPAP
jgi:hypothetical protein